MKFVIRNYKLEGIITIILGLLLIIIPVSFILNVVTSILGFLLLLFGLFTVLSISGLSSTKHRLYYVVLACVLIVLGIFLLVYNLDFLASICGALLIADGIIRIVKSPDKKAGFQKHLIRILIGVVLIFLGFVPLAQFFVYVAGGVLILFGLYKLIFVKNFVINFNEPQNSNKGITSDSIDVEFEDVKNRNE